jgi:glycine/D-amino acid oxidase-like deaminating enzyme
VPSATIVGAGVFGAWIAYALKQRHWTVTLIEQHGPGNSRSSSGGETRIIRAGYGDHAIYAQWASDALPRWLALELASAAPVFVRTGALFLGRDAAWLRRTLEVLHARHVRAEWLNPGEVATRYPQLRFEDSAGAVFEEDAGVLFARQAVQALVRLLRTHGVEVVTDRADPHALMRTSRDDALVFAAGPWLPALFPDILRDVIVPTRQEVFFFGVPPGARNFGPGALPAWVAFDDGIYGLPDLEHRGVKVAVDAHGPPVDPETMERAVHPDTLARMRDVLRRRVPALAGAPLVESRVCQYENTPDGHFLLDRLPGQDRVWLAGGGSGHGFKHGPSVGEYMADVIEGRRPPEQMFQLGGRPSRARAVY